jgi:simple sugar transport system ATP-binding protein
LQKDKIKAYCQNVVDQYDVRCRSINDSVRTLSGGNQQKLVIGREFSLNPTFILAAQPTRGLDVGPSNLIIGKF